MKQIQILLIALTMNTAVLAKEYHVAKTGNDKNPGTAIKAFLSVQAASDIAQPGDIIMVHEGIYRERITPPRGGTSNDKRIVYLAAEGEKVEIKGSEIIKDWMNFTDDVWKVTIPNSFFGNYNPYKDIIHGDWFKDMGRVHHTGEVYLNGKSLWESATLDGVLNLKPQKYKFDPEGSTYTWFCESDKDNTYIYANFHDANPNKDLVEINVRESCFYPEKTGINYITVSGFILRHAATQWAPPTAEQIGLIGTNWSKGWIIKNNIISDSRCSGITLGKYGDEFDNTSQNSAGGYVETIKRAQKKGWSKENIGSHIIRNNTIYNCEQTGICGSLGAIFSIIENNNIYNIWTKRQFDGAEIAGIKIHASIDMLIKGNRVVNAGRGIWLDWMAQGTRVTSNLCYSNILYDLYAEVNHGPYQVDNNIFLSLCSVWDMSQGGAYVHNLMTGKINMSPHSRVTPYHYPHSTEIAGYHELLGGDDRFFNNIFVGGCELNKDQMDPSYESRISYGKEFFGLKAYKNPAFTVSAAGNVYWKNAEPVATEENKLLELDFDPEINIKEERGEVFLIISYSSAASKMNNQLIGTNILGKSLISGQPFENPDGSSYQIDSDFLGEPRNSRNPTAGPFETIGKGIQTFKVWPKK